ncbi:MAG: hypothetical protein WB778_07365 [Thermoplasmata archaeon]
MTPEPENARFFDKSGTIERSSDAELYQIIESFDRLSYGLVLLENKLVEEIGIAIRRLRAAVEQHVENSRGQGRFEVGDAASDSSRRREIADDHARFRTSLAELATLFEIIRRDDHGGNRQALGQYGKILSEALRIHLAAEDSAGASGLTEFERERAPESLAPDQLP